MNITSSDVLIQDMDIDKKITTKLHVHQRAIERKLLGISLRDRKTNVWIREQTKGEDI